MQYLNTINFYNTIRQRPGNLEMLGCFLFHPFSMNIGTILAITINSFNTHK